MLLRGYRQHDIASYFGVNPGRISEVENGTNTYPNAQPTPEGELPPPGPYLTKFALQSVIDTLNEAISVIELAEAEEEIADVKAALALAKETIQNKINSLEEI
jgi:transcriptional regulator with XRE-family HTH domain